MELSFFNIASVYGLLGLAPDLSEIELHPACIPSEYPGSFSLSSLFVLNVFDLTLYLVPPIESELRIVTFIFLFLVVALPLYYLCLK